MVVENLNFQYDGIFYEVLDELGEMPLPPYIKEQLEDQDRYQTVYAKRVQQLHQRQDFILRRVVRRD